MTETTQSLRAVERGGRQFSVKSLYWGGMVAIGSFLYTTHDGASNNHLLESIPASTVIEDMSRHVAPVAALTGLAAEGFSRFGSSDRRSQVYGALTAASFNTFNEGLGYVLERFNLDHNALAEMTISSHFRLSDIVSGFGIAALAATCTPLTKPADQP